MGKSSFEAALWGGFSASSLKRLGERAARSSHDELSFTWARTRTHYALGENDDALAWLERTREIGSWRREPVDLALYRCELLSALGRNDEAVATARTLHERFGGDPVILLALASAYASAGAPSETVVGVLNQIYRDAGLADLRVRSAYDRATLQNLAPGSLSSGTTTETRFSNRLCSDPLVSVIMPTHNAQGTIGYAMRSVLDQTEQRLELIVVNDASTDGSRIVAERIASRDTRVRIIDLDRNAGTYAARNLGLAEARGRFTTVNDADDWSHPERLAVQLRDLDNGVRFNTTSGVPVRFDLRLSPHPRGARCIRENLSSLMIRTDDLRAAGGWDTVRFGADSELYERLKVRHRQGRRRIHRSVPLSFLLRSEGSLTAAQYTGAWSSRFGARREYKDSYRDWHARTAKPVMLRSPRPFPVPAIAVVPEPNEYKFDLLIIGDLCIAPHSTVMDEAEATEAVGVLHVPSLTTIDASVAPLVRERLRRCRWHAIVPGEGAIVEQTVVTSLGPIQDPPDLWPKLRSRRASVYAANSVPDPSMLEAAKRLFDNEAEITFV